MTYLCVYHESQPLQPVRLLNHLSDISSELAALGVELMQHQLPEPAAGLSDAALLEACAEQLAGLQGSHFASTRLHRLGGPNTLLRRRSLPGEHRLDETALYLCLQGPLLLCLHQDAHAYALHCMPGDGVLVPQALPRWLAAGAEVETLLLSLCASDAGQQQIEIQPDSSGLYPGLPD